MNYYYLALNGQQAGPYPAAEIIAMLRDGRANAQTLCFTKGMNAWTPLGQVAEFQSAMPAGATSAIAAAPPLPGAPPIDDYTTPSSAPMSSGRVETRHGMSYEIVGHEMQFVEVMLNTGNTVIAEAGCMMFMSQGIQMDTQLGTQTGGGLLDKVFEAGKRVLTGATLFLTTYSNMSGRRETVAFSAPYPGKIVPIDFPTLGGQIICEKHSFLCASRGTVINIEFTRRIGAGFFGGEGFILQRLQGSGMAFIHACGTVVERTLMPGESIRVDTGCLVAFQPSVSYDIQFVGNIKTALFGGEGLFFVNLTGPGKVWLQSLPFSRLADRIIAASPRAGGRRQEAGSVLGNLGDLIGGDQ